MEAVEAEAQALAEFFGRVREKVLTHLVARLHGGRWSELPEQERVGYLPDLLDSIALIDHPSLAEGLALAQARLRYAAGFEPAETMQEISWLREALGLAIFEDGNRLPALTTAQMHQALDRVSLVISRYFTQQQTAGLERLVAEAQAARAEADVARARLEEALASMTDGFVRLDGDFRVVYLNQAAGEILGMPLESLRGAILWEALPGLRETHLGQRYVEALRGQFAIEELGRYGGRWFEVRAFPGRGGLSISFRDVTERLDHERERQELLEVLEWGDAVVIVGPDWTVTWANEMAEELFRTPRQRMVGQPLYRSFPTAFVPGSLLHQQYHRVMDERRMVQFETYDPSRELWTEVRAYPTQTGGFAAFVRDITDRKRAEEMERVILGVVGHDLRNPLATIQLSGRLLERMAGLPEDARRSIERVVRSSERMDRMIRDLLDYSKVRSGTGLPIERRRVALADILHQVEGEFSVTAPDRLQIERADEICGCWDADRVVQMLVNLCSNAVRYGAADTPVTLSAKADDSEVHITVHNRGQPIEPDAVERLFRPFRRGTADPGGLGLGLFICKAIAEGHGGRIEVESTQASGTRFIAILPMGC